MVAKEAPEIILNIVIDIATKSSKKFETAIIEPGQELESFNLKTSLKKAVK